MNLTMIKKDFSRNKAINITLLLFIVLSACLISVGTMIVIQLFGAIDSMYEIAKPPHFMQMHTGEINWEELNDFAESVDYVESWQVIEMVNIYGGNIRITKPDGKYYVMSDSLLDIGFVKQNDKYDLLLDTNNTPIYPSKGEIGVPIILLDSYDIKIGDTLTITEGDYSKDFTVTSYVRDSQMNSTLCSSTRFLINEEEHDEIKNRIGKIEYLIEFYFPDESLASKFQTTYEKAGMPANGQPITYAIIRLVSGISDIIMVLIIVLVSLFLIFVVAICLRFTILTAMEEEIKSIGTMRAIGMSYKNISQIYLIKYRFLAILGCIAGYALSLVINKYFTSHIAETFGPPKLTLAAMLAPIATVCLVYLFEIYFCKKIIKKIKRITIVEALRSGADRSKANASRVAKFINLSKFKSLPVDILMAVQDVAVKARAWLLLFFVILIAIGIMVVPVNLHNTFKSPKFITYMGQSQSDIVVSLAKSENIAEKFDEVFDVLNSDSEVEDYNVEAEVVYEAINKDGDWTNIHVDCSDVAKSELQYLEGKAPENENQIALSVLNANEMGVKVGDTLPMLINGQEMSIVVSGIYQDVTSGGFTAKMMRPYDKEAVEGYSFYINVKDGVNIQKKIDLYKNKMGVETEVVSMEEFIDQTLGGVSRQLGKAVVAVIIMSMCLVALIIILFFNLQAAKEYSQVAIMKAIGFSVQDIRKQYLLKVLMVSMIGIVFGTVLANALGEGIVSGILSILGLGISKITFIINRSFVASSLL
jgi:putative ABC transport system permease protein